MMGLGVVSLARAVALLAPALALMGYFAASHFLFYGVVLSGGVVGFCILLFHVVQDTVERIVSTGEETQPAQESRVRLVPVAVAFLLICAALPVLAIVWGANMTDLSTGWRTISDGFHVGDVVISPVRFFGFLLVFSICYVLTRIVQGVLTRSVLPYSGLDAGGKAAVRAGVFYVGVFLSALVAISATGLDLSSLAIVAGALSVGIGFGLQSIVNNFISGLILLVERPIKVGDRVTVNGQDGFVRRISVRSTEIETFDRASLIVPNAEFITTTVVNWTHRNTLGRALINVSAGYDADPDQVLDILLKAAHECELVLKHPPPWAGFDNFGPDGLDFILIAVVTDVNKVGDARSDVRIRILRAVRAAGIEIPYPQRDFHIRDLHKLRDVFERVGGGTAAGEEAGLNPATRSKVRG
jgi:small-conductance mechanosensitive channel